MRSKRETELEFSRSPAILQQERTGGAVGNELVAVRRPIQKTKTSTLLPASRAYTTDGFSRLGPRATTGNPDADTWLWQQWEAQFRRIGAALQFGGHFGHQYRSRHRREDDGGGSIHSRGIRHQLARDKCSFGSLPLRFAGAITMEMTLPQAKPYQHDDETESMLVVGASRRASRIRNAVQRI